MLSSVIPARLEFSCGHAALVSLPRLKGENAAQRTQRISTEKSRARGRACDFCGQREQVLVEVRSLQETAPSGTRNGHQAVDEQVAISHRAETSARHPAVANGQTAARPRGAPAVRGLHRPVKPEVQSLEATGTPPPAVVGVPAALQAPAVAVQSVVSAASTDAPAPVAAPAPAPSASPTAAAAPAASAPSIAPVEPAARAQRVTTPVPAASTAGARRPRRHVAVTEPTPIRGGRVSTPRRGPGPSARAVARPAPAATKPASAVAAGRLQRFQIRFSAETVVSAPDIRAALRQLESLGATDIVSIALTHA